MYSKKYISRIIFLFLFFFSFSILSNEEPTKTLQEEETIAGTEYSVGSILSFSEEGKLLSVVLGKEQYILDKLGESPKFPYLLPSGTVLTFDPTNKDSFLPTKIKLSSKIEIAGIQFPEGSIFQISGGKFISKEKVHHIVEITCKLKKKQKVSGIEIPSGTIVYIDSRGRVKKNHTGKWVPLDFVEVTE